MKKSIPPSSPDAYVTSLAGWQRVAVERLRGVVLKSAAVEEVIKWGNLVYLANGPVLLIRAEEHRVLLGFWRGKRLRKIDSRLKLGGKYEMATIELHENDVVISSTVRLLVAEAVRLNKTLGNPTKV